MSVKTLARRLKKWPSLYRVVLNTYYTLRPVHLMELLFGTKAREREWTTRHLRKGNDWGSARYTGENDEWVLSYWDSREHQHRPFLVEKISSFHPFSDVLEIGCNCGPNLYLLAGKFPGVKMTGIDINPRAIQKGNELFASEGISNVKLLVGKADELGQFQDRSFDVVFTDAILIYVGRDKIRSVISEMVRIARKGIVLLEQHCFEGKNSVSSTLGVRRLGLWQRDYVALLKEFVPEERIGVTKVTNDMWPDHQWQEAGAIIELTL